MANGVLGDGQFSGEVHERVHTLRVDAQRARQRISANGDRRDRIGRGAVVRVLRRRFNGAREAGRIEAGEAFRDSLGNPFGDVCAPLMAEDIGGHTPGRGEPTLQSLATDGQQRDLFAQNGERHIRALRLRRYDGRLRLRRFHRRGLVVRLSRRKAGRESTRRGVGLVRKLAALLDRIEPLNDLVKTGQAVADEAGGDRAIALANHRQDILGGMHRAPHRREVDDTGAALERVKRAERPIQARTVARIALQGEEIGGGLLDQLARLHEKLFEELVHWGTPQNIAMVRARSSRPTGLAE